MKLYNVLFFMSFVSFNLAAMELPNVKLNKFWQTVRNEKYTDRQTETYLRSKVLTIMQSGKEGDEITEKLHQLFLQAICSGHIDPFKKLFSKLNEEKEDLFVEGVGKFANIVGFALAADKTDLIKHAFASHVISKEALNGIISHYDDTDESVLSAALFEQWPFLKKYGADFNLKLVNSTGTLLHQPSVYLNAEKVNWLLENTAIDVNEKDATEQTVAHKLASFCADDVKNAYILSLLFNAGMNPLLTNKKGLTPRQVAANTLNVIKKFPNPESRHTIGKYENIVEKLTGMETRYQQTN